MQSSNNVIDQHQHGNHFGRSEFLPRSALRPSPYIMGIALTTCSPSKCQGCLRRRGEMSWTYVGPRRNVAPGNHFRRASRRVDIRYYIAGVGPRRTYYLGPPDKAKYDLFRLGPHLTLINPPTADTNLSFPYLFRVPTSGFSSLTRQVVLPSLLDLFGMQSTSHAENFPPPLCCYCIARGQETD